MRSLVSFGFKNNPIGVVGYKWQLWYVAKDICLTLGYVKIDHAISKHCTEPKSLGELLVDGSVTLIKTPQNQGFMSIYPHTILIPEYDVYALIFGSDLEAAYKFHRWVWDDVVPALRKSCQ